MENSLDEKVVKLPTPTLATMTYEQFEEAHEKMRKGFVKESERKYVFGSRAKKAVAAVVAAGALFLSGMYVGARYSKELGEACNSTVSYFSSTAEAVENQNQTYQRR
jgi:hypothetical protein